MTAPQTVTSVYDDTTDKSEACHIWCDCSIDVARCGADITGLPIVDATNLTLCVVCDDLDEIGARCPTCTTG